MSKKTLFLYLMACMLFSESFAQVPVDVNLNVEHIVGDKSEFDRNKYITLHSQPVDSEWPNQVMQDTFLVNYDVHYGRNNGILPWHATTIKEDANKPGWPDVNEIKSKSADLRSGYANQTYTHKYESRSDMVIGGQKSKLHTQQFCNR